ncbi:MAG: radical SAM protein [Anaerolineae bacterium]
MTNLVISAVCNQSCPYCFTVDHLGLRGAEHTGGGEHFLPLEALAPRLDFLARSGMEQVRLMGGEPTLHPRFPELVRQIRSTGRAVTVFSNGLMPAGALDCLEALEPENCVVMVNVNEPEPDQDGRTYARQRDTLWRLGRRAILGFNIYRTDFRPEFLLDLVAETGCSPRIRLSMAQPTLSGANRHVHPTQYRAVARAISRFARLAGAAGVILEFDCGFVRCMFSAGDLEVLRAAGANFGWHCNPILDIDLDGSVLHCYPLARLASLPLAAGTDAASMRGEFERRLAPYRQAGVYAECSSCAFKTRGECTGGCLAATIRRFRDTPLRVWLPAGEGAAGARRNEVAA